MHAKQQARLCTIAGSTLPRLITAAAVVSLAASAHAASDCAGLTAVKPEATTITSATLVGAPSTIGGAKVGVPFCRVEGVARPSADSEIKFEVWLPAADKWTGRLKVDGTGGYAGGVPYALLAQDIGDGFVTAGSNMGHDGGESPAWTVNHPEKVKDWGLRAHYSVATAAKALSATYYDKPVRYSYFEGCSNGGRQAMMMAQNYPELFDGIAAGAPSMFYPDLLFWLLWTGKQQVPEVGKPPVLSDAKRALITKRILDKCDAMDGLVDGQITNPRACVFDIDTLGPSGDNSLTAAELAVVKAMYGGTRTESGVQRYPGAKLGSETDWIPLFADNGGYGLFIEHFVYSRNTPGFDWRRAAELFQRLRRSESEAHAVHRGAEPGHHRVHEPRRQVAALPRLERSRRDARRLDRLPVCAHPVRALPQSAEGRLRPRDRCADAAGCRGVGRAAAREGPPVPSAVHGARDGALLAERRGSAPHRRRRVGAAGRAARRRPSRRRRADEVGRAGRRAGLDHRRARRGRQGDAAAAGVRVSGAGSLQGFRRRQRCSELRVRDAEGGGSTVDGQRHDSDTELVAGSGG